VATRLRAPVGRQSAHRPAGSHARGAANPAAVLRVSPRAATRETDGSRNCIDRLDLVQAACTIGWRSITTVCWMLEVELAVSAGLLRIVTKQLPKTRSPRTRSPKERGSLDFTGPTPVSAGIVRGLTSMLLAGAADIVSVSRKSRIENASNTEKAPAVLQLPGPLSPLQTGERALVIENTYEGRTANVSFASSDLLAVSGERISSSCLRFDPASLTIAPAEKGQVLVSLTVPKNTPTGIYEGALQCRGVHVAHTLVRVSVA